jgi:four helix bundle protein
MNADDLRKRLKVFALRIIKLTESLPNNITGKTLGNQIIRSGTSPGANYRSACLGKSEKDFLNKLKMVEEELDETLYWLELIVESGLVKPNLLDDLIHENQELFKIIVSSITTMKKKLNSKKISSESKS